MGRNILLSLLFLCIPPLARSANNVSIFFDTASAQVCFAPDEISNALEENAISVKSLIKLARNGVSLTKKIRLLFKS